MWDASRSDRFSRGHQRQARIGVAGRQPDFHSRRVAGCAQDIPVVANRTGHPAREEVGPRSIGSGPGRDGHHRLQGRVRHEGGSTVGSSGGSFQSDPAPAPKARAKKAAAEKPGAASGDWPQFRGPNRDNISTEKGLLERWPQGGPRLAWKATGLGEGYSSVAVAGDTVFTMGTNGRDEHLYALSRDDGDKKWSIRTGTNRGDGAGGGHAELPPSTATASTRSAPTEISCVPRPTTAMSSGR